MNAAVRRVFNKGGWSGFLLEVWKFPLPPLERRAYIEQIDSLKDALSKEKLLQKETWLQMHAFPPDDTARLLSQNAARWKVLNGLGVWPDREPARLWTKHDFTDRDYGSPLPTLMYTVFHLTGGVEAAQHAWTTVFGRGATVHLLMEAGAGSWHSRIGPVLSASITEPAFQGKQFYFPLLEAASLVKLSPDYLSDLRSSVRLYVRESVEDGGILVLIQTHLLSQVAHLEVLPAGYDAGSEL